MEREEFFAAVAVLLEVKDDYVEPKPFYKRWGRRKPGNGRYPGFGVILWYGPKLIHTMIEGSSTSTFDSPERALTFILNLRVQRSELVAAALTIGD